jgi:drug/metabolite transporter, DME family
MLRHRLLVLAAAVFWSTGGAAIKLCGLNANQISVGRSLIAAAFLALAVKESRRWPSRQVLLVALAYAGTVSLFVLANKLTTSANAIFLQDTAPLYVLFLSVWLLGEKPRRADVISVPIFVAGLALFFLDELSAGQLRGNVIALASGVCFALLIVGTRRIGDAGMAAVLWGNVMAGVAGLPFALTGSAPTPGDLGLLLYLGVVQLGLGYFAFTRGLKNTPAFTASLLVLLEPVLNPVWAFLLTGERPGPWALAGGAIILGATAWQAVRPAEVATRITDEPAG